MSTARQIAALSRLAVRHWMRSALTAGAAAKTGGSSRFAGLALRGAFLLLVGRSFHQVAKLAVSEKAPPEATIPWLLTGVLVAAAGFGVVPLLPALRGARNPLQRDLLETLPITAAARVALAVLQNVLGLVLGVGVALGAASPEAHPAAAALVGVAMHAAGVLGGVGALWLLRLVVPAHWVARATWLAVVVGVAGMILLQLSPLLARGGIPAPWAPLLAPCAAVLAGRASPLWGLVPPVAIGSVAALCIALAERRGYDRLIAPAPGKARFSPPKRMTPEAVDRLLTAREMGVVLRAVLLGLPTLAVLVLVFVVPGGMRPSVAEGFALGVCVVVLQLASSIGMGIAGRSAVRDARARPLLAPLTMVPADTLVGKERSLGRLLLPSAVAPFLVLAVAPAEALPVVLTRAVALAVGLALYCSAITSLAFLTNGLGSGAGAAPFSPAMLLLLLPLLSAVLAKDPWSAALSLAMLALFTFEARRAALRCVRWLDDEAEDVERSTPVWRALLVLGAFFAVQTLAAQLLAFLLDENATGLLAGLAYAASAVALLLLTLSARRGEGLRFLPEGRRWLLVVGPLAGAASGLVGQLYLRALVWAEVELPKQPAFDTASLLVFGAAVVVAAPVAEEVFFRGWLQPSVAGELPPAWRRLAPVATAVAFALVHPALSFPPVLVLGILAGELCWLGRGGLLPGILAHAVHNAMAIVLHGS